MIFPLFEPTTFPLLLYAHGRERKRIYALNFGAVSPDQPARRSLFFRPVFFRHGTATRERIDSFPSPESRKRKEESCRDFPKVPCFSYGKSQPYSKLREARMSLRFIKAISWKYVFFTTSGLKWNKLIEWRLLLLLIGSQYCVLINRLPINRSLSLDISSPPPPLPSSVSVAISCDSDRGITSLG